MEKDSASAYALQYLPLLCYKFFHGTRESTVARLFLNHFDPLEYLARRMIFHQENGNERKRNTTSCADNLKHRG